MTREDRRLLSDMEMEKELRKRINDVLASGETKDRFVTSQATCALTGASDNTGFLTFVFLRGKFP